MFLHLGGLFLPILLAKSIQICNQTFNYMSIEQLLGKTFSSVEVNEDRDVMRFIVDKNESYTMFHEQDCCEQVAISDINGDLEDLIGSPITLAEESSNREYLEFGRITWTFYRLATVKGYVDIRWHGSSNGYYSEAVSFVKDGEDEW